MELDFREMLALREKARELKAMADKLYEDIGHAILREAVNASPAAAPRYHTYALLYWVRNSCASGNSCQ